MFKYRVVSLLICFSIILSIVLPASVVCTYAEDNESHSDGIIVSLGDSFSSGEGVEEFFGQNESTEKKVNNPDWLSHRSKHAWSGQLYLKDSEGNKILMNENRNENWYFVAMSGAVTQNILDTEKLEPPLTKKIKKQKEYRLKEYKQGDTKGIGIIDSQLDVFAELDKKNKKADYVTITMGGNDLKFADVVAKSVTHKMFTMPNLTYLMLESLKKKELPKTIENLRKCYESINEASHGAHIIVAGYPRLFDGFSIPLLLSEDQAKWINEATSEFNQKIEQLVDECENNMNISFVSVEGKFKNHGAYSDKSQSSPIAENPKNTLTEGEYLHRVILGAQPQDLKDSSIASAYSVHPNLRGINAYRECVQEELNKLDKAKAAKRQPKIDYDTLVTDANKRKLVYTETVYDSQKEDYIEKNVTISFSIPKINFHSPDVEEINSYLSEKYNNILKKCMDEISKYGRPGTSKGVRYTWNINDDILSLVVYNDYAPYSSGATEYEAFNVQFPAGKKLSANDVYTKAGYSESKYFKRIEQVMGSKFFENLGDYVKEFGYQESTISQYKATVARENLEKATPYFNESGELCIVGDVYTIAGSGCYMKNMNIDNFVANDTYLEYINMETKSEQGGYVDKYIAKLKTYPTNEYSYSLYDINKDSVPELFIRNGSQHNIYTYDGNNVIEIGETYWLYDPCMYEYNGNGIVIHDGGMGYMRLEYIFLFTLKNNQLQKERIIIGSEHNTMQEVYDELKKYKQIEGSYKMNDFAPLESLR